MGIDVSGVFDDLFGIFDKGFDRFRQIKALEAAEDFADRLNPVGQANATTTTTGTGIVNWTPVLIGAVGLLAVVFMTRK